jgi:hypothetical protein
VVGAILGGVLLSGCSQKEKPAGPTPPPVTQAEPKAGPKDGSKAELTAVPNPVPAGKGLGKTTLSWNIKGNKNADLYVSVDGGPERLFAKGGIKGKTTVPWISNDTRYTFSVYATKEHQTPLASVKVEREKSPGAVSAAPARLTGTITATPNPVPPGKGLGTTKLVWKTTSPTAAVFVVQDKGAEKLFSEGAKGVQNVPWILGGSTYDFRVYESKARKRKIASVVVTRAKGAPAGAGLPAAAGAPPASPKPGPKPG